MRPSIKIFTNVRPITTSPNGTTGNMSLTNNRIEIEPYQVQAPYGILNSYDHWYLINNEFGIGKIIEASIPTEITSMKHIRKVIKPTITFWSDSA